MVIMTYIMLQVLRLAVDQEMLIKYNFLWDCKEGFLLFQYTTANCTCRLKPYSKSTTGLPQPAVVGRPFFNRLWLQAFLLVFQYKNYQLQVKVKPHSKSTTKQPGIYLSYFFKNSGRGFNVCNVILYTIWLEQYTTAYILIFQLHYTNTKSRWTERKWVQLSVLVRCITGLFICFFKVLWYLASPKCGRCCITLCNKSENKMIR